MAFTPFVFSSESLPRLKAKQLSKVFPFLRLSTAQEATAQALGYSSWYECIQRGTKGEAGLSDQDAGMPVRVGRYYHQAAVLTSLGIAPSEADVWVRGWGLTGHPSLAPRRAIPTYQQWSDALERLERGEISEEVAREMWEGEFSKYPEISRPERVCPGVILGPCGKYPHYAVDPAISRRIPIYLRGGAGLYHLEDDHDVLAVTVEGFPSRPKCAESFKERLNYVHHEWHFGEKHPRASKAYLPRLEEAALAAPDAMVVISLRAMPDSHGSFDFDLCALACLRGRDFLAFLRAKGVIDPTKVVWYRNLDARRLHIGWPNSHDTYDGFGGAGLPVFADANKHRPSLPLYSYPFMQAPMLHDEYSQMIESSCLLPLDEDYSDDEGDDDDDGGDDFDPAGPTPVLEATH